MNTEQAIEYTIKALKSQESRMPADMADYRNELIKDIEDRRFLGAKHRHSIALALFSYSMYNGPVTFSDTGDAVIELGVEIEFEKYTTLYRDDFSKNASFLKKAKEVLFGK